MNAIEILSNCQLVWRNYIMPTPCWEWTKRTEKGYAKGYAIGESEGKTQRLYRFVYENLIGKVTKGHCLHHVCYNRKCCNPYHLQPMSNKEHILLEALSRTKPHCKRGHKFTPENTYAYPSGRTCKQCAREKHLQSYQVNKERLLENVKAYRAKNREKVLARKRAYREANKERINEAQRRWYAERKAKSE